MLRLTLLIALLAGDVSWTQANEDGEKCAAETERNDFNLSKGFLFFFLSRMTQSAETFENCLKSDPDDIGVILFHYLVETKIGNALAAARELEADSAKLKERH